MSLTAKKNSASPDAPVLLSVPTITITQATFRFIEDNANGDVPGTLTKWLSYFLDRQARGGLMLEPEDTARLAAVRDGKVLKSSREVVSLVEKGLKREDGQYTQTINIDPALITPLEDQAKLMGDGWTVQTLMEAVINMALVNSWAYNFTPDHTINLTDYEYQRISRVLGKSVFFGSDLSDALCGVEKTEEKQAA